MYFYGLLVLLLDLFNPILDAKRQRVGIIGAIQAIGVLGEKGRNHLINNDGRFLSYLETLFIMLTRKMCP